MRGPGAGLDSGPGPLIVAGLAARLECITVTINELLTALCDELADGDVPYRLEHAWPLGLVWIDLCRLAGEEPPADVAALIDRPACEAPPRRRSA